MKKRIPVLALLAILFLLMIGSAQGEGRRLTIMIYLCGSNLESTGGAASADIQEMVDSGAPGSDVSLLVMAGGTSSWYNGYHPEEMSVTEIRKGKARIVERFAARNMGNAETLQSFLRFSMDNYPADDYALILWDHGGGPLNGVCWDELFSLDHLSLSELTQALSSANMEKKLKWIGFDACLMGSMEVAFAVSPYAEYMIASQETEPATGWNYSFLKEPELTGDGAETGRIIVDAYFEGQENTGDILTLSCLNLSKVDEVREQMNQFFAPVSSEMDDRYFAMLSDVRYAAVGFGKGIRASGEEGYDLVDAADLIGHMDVLEDEKQQLLQSLDGMISYNRSNEPNARGISLYHPYSNKKQYKNEWREGYRDLDFCQGYLDYVEKFGALLTGEQMTDWSGLKTEYLGTNENGDCVLELALTEEQRDGMVSAQLLILVSGFSHIGEMDETALVYSGPAEITGSGKVHAVYDKRTLWIVDESENITGPIPFDLTDKGEHQVISVSYTPKGYHSWETDQVPVRYYLDSDAEGNIPAVVRTTVYDEATQSYTNRLGLNEAQYEEATFLSSLSLLPDISDPLPAYHEWPVDQNSITYRRIPLPQNWHFQYMDEFLSGEQYFALFQITDLQQRVYCSEPVLIPNPNLIKGEMEQEEQRTEDVSVRCGLLRDSSPVESGAMLYVTVGNRSDTKAHYSIDEILINGTRRIRRYCSFLNVPPGGSQSERIDLSEESLRLLPEITSVTLMLRKGITASAADAIPLSFQLRDSLPGDGTEPAIMGQVESGGIRWELLSFSENETGEMEALVRVSNRTDARVDLKSQATAAGPFPPDSVLFYSGVDALQPGEDTVAHLTFSDSAALEAFAPVNGAETSGGSQETGAADTEKKKTTVMIYMCGGDREALFGQGSELIHSIQAKGFDAEQVNVIAMLGGASRWQNGYDPEKRILLEPGKEPSEAVYWDQASMGDPETLTAFLQYCAANHPAECYDLILWGHGGGPDQGICFDANADGDSLSVSELSAALAGSPFAEGGLHLVVFDAPLTSSVEYASALAPYARYMIAPEEAGCGLSYDWISSLDTDVSSTGMIRKIVDDTYALNAFAASTDSEEGPEFSLMKTVITALDLTEIPSVVTSMDSFFELISPRLESGSMAENAKQLRDAFFPFVSADTGMRRGCLIDLGDLIRQLAGDTPEEAADLLSAIGRAVMYVRKDQSAQDRTGMSVCHPNTGGDSAYSKLEAYRECSPSGKYMDYLLRYHAFLTEKPLAEWTDLKVTLSSDFLKDKRVVLQMELTDDQMENLTDFRVLVLRLQEGNDYALISERQGDISLFDDGLLWEFGVRYALYVVSPSGEILTPPVPYLVESDQAILIPARLTGKGAENAPGVPVQAMLRCVRENDGTLRTERIFLMDEWTGVYSDWNGLLSDSFTEIEISLISRYKTWDEKDDLLPFREWDIAEAASWTFRLDDTWSFRLIEGEISDHDLFAAFQVMDTQNQTHQSSLWFFGSIKPEAVPLYKLEAFADGEETVSVSQFDLISSSGSVILKASLTNLADQEVIFTVREICLNGLDTEMSETLYGSGDNWGLCPGETQTMTISIPASFYAETKNNTEMSFMIVALDASDGETVLGTTLVRCRSMN